MVVADMVVADMVVADSVLVVIDVAFMVVDDSVLVVIVPVEVRPVTVLNVLLNGGCPSF